MRILWRAFTLSSHGGLCFFYYSNKIFYTVQCLFSAEAILFQYIFSSGRKHALGKTAYLPNRTCVGASLMY